MANENEGQEGTEGQEGAEGQNGAEGAGGAEGAEGDRSVENYKAEIARRKANEERLAAELDAAKANANRPNVKDPTDLSTWTDQELRAVAANPEPQYAVARERAKDILDDRRVQRMLDARELERVRESAEDQRMREYPETLDPSHPMAIEMKRIMKDRHLDKTPAGYLVAAELAASRMRKGTERAKGAERERERVAAIRGSQQGEDRPNPPRGKETQEALAAKAIKGGQVVDEEAFKKVVAARIIPA